MLGIERSELGGCRLIRRIGEGAMGEVYLAEQISLGNRLVAVKVVREEHDITPPPPNAPEGARWHFVREAALLGQLTHPNILPVYHSGTEAGYLFLVMQYAPDGSLADAIKGKGPHALTLPAGVPSVVDIVAQLASALQYTHEHHVIHADVKPSNVLVQAEPNGHWHMMLADFGVARSMDSLALRDEVAGTAAYMAPEQFFGQLSPACDQYALGVMAFQLLTGRLPFTGGLIELVNAHAREVPPALHDLNPAVSPSVEEVILGALSKQPEDRYRSVADFALALRAAATGANTTVVAPSNSRTDWAGAGPALAKGDTTARTARTARTAPASPWRELSSVRDTFERTVPLAAYPAEESPASARTRDRNGRRRIAPGLAVLALLLVSGIAGLSLRDHIDIGRASSWLGGASSTPTAPGAGAGASPSSSPTTAPATVPPAPGGGGPVIILPTNTPAAQPTPQSSPAPTATPAGQPTATTPSPTATPATVPSPTDTPTVAPSPAATATAEPKPKPTATAQPTEPAPPATPQSSGAGAPGTTPAASDPHLPASVPGTP